MRQRLGEAYDRSSGLSVVASAVPGLQLSQPLAVGVGQGVKPGFGFLVVNPRGQPFAALDLAL
jgi:hypothetical protein